MIGYWQDQTGSIDAGFFQFTIQTHFAIATFRRYTHATFQLFFQASSSSLVVLTWTRSLP